MTFSSAAMYSRNGVPALGALNTGGVDKYVLIPPSCHESIRVEKRELDDKKLPGFPTVGANCRCFRTSVGEMEMEVEGRREGAGGGGVYRTRKGAGVWGYGLAMQLLGVGVCACERRIPGELIVVF